MPLEVLGYKRLSWDKGDSKFDLHWPLPLKGRPWQQNGHFIIHQGYRTWTQPKYFSSLIKDVDWLVFMSSWRLYHIELHDWIRFKMFYGNTLRSERKMTVTSSFKVGNTSVSHLNTSLSPFSLSCSLLLLASLLFYCLPISASLKKM